ncbi:nucleoside/nucleotide kinase family protein [Roseixanthobacter pseudopolyaromaticivorans]|uniref:hypothetical protein n=1 Tax=Xanthobacteraceae TaxID=335928 RepID=UPI0037297B45
MIIGLTGRAGVGKTTAAEYLEREHGFVRMIASDLRTQAWSAPVAAPRVVADDVRFTNEADAIRARGGIIVEIHRPGSGDVTGADHISEAMPIEPDLRVVNPLGPGLYRRLDDLYSWLDWHARDAAAS